MNKCKIVLAVAVLAAAACEATNHEREAAYYNTAAVCEAEVLARPGTIPGALNLPMTWITVDDSLYFRGPDQLEALFAAAGAPALEPMEISLKSPSLQLSVPGQETTSEMVCAPVSDNSMASKDRQTSCRNPSGTQRSTRFCSWLAAARPPV